MNEANLITPKEASKLLKVTVWQVRHLVRKGDIKIAFGSTGTGNRYLLDRNEVKEFAKKPRRAGRPKVRKKEVEV